MSSKRIRLSSPSYTSEEGGAYFLPPSSVHCFSSGCCLLDCVLGGGYALGRVVNIVGDKSTGKTLLAIEACANFARTFRGGLILYRETEAAFDQRFATTLGLPIERVEFPAKPAYTVDDIFEEMIDFVERCRKKQGLYLLDSLDALSDKDEMESEFGKASYGTQKAKAMSQLFRRLIQKLENSHVTVFIISQVRDNIGVTFGRKLTRSGGRALDFYASQSLWLSQVKRITKTVKGMTRSTGVFIKAFCEKNKIGLPFRDCVFPIRFGFGVDDLEANVLWLIETKNLEAAGFDSQEQALQFLKDMRKVSDEEYREAVSDIATTVRKLWGELEQRFSPVRKKYS